MPWDLYCCNKPDCISACRHNKINLRFFKMKYSHNVKLAGIWNAYQSTIDIQVETYVDNTHIYFYFFFAE